MLTAFVMLWLTDCFGLRADLVIKWAAKAAVELTELSILKAVAAIWSAVTFAISIKFPSGEHPICRQ